MTRIKMENRRENYDVPAKAALNRNNWQHVAFSPV